MSLTAKFRPLSLAFPVVAGLALSLIAAAGRSGSVVGDTTTTMMWIAGVNPLQVLDAYVAVGLALLIFGVPAAFQQHRYSPISKRAPPMLAVVGWHPDASVAKTPKVVAAPPVVVPPANVRAN